MKSSITGYEVYHTLLANSKQQHERKLFSTGELVDCRQQALSYFEWLINFCVLKYFPCFDNTYTVICNPIYSIEEYSDVVPPIAIHKPTLTFGDADKPEVFMEDCMGLGVLLSYGKAMEELHLPHYNEVDSTELFSEIKALLAMYN